MGQIAPQIASDSFELTPPDASQPDAREAGTELLDHAFETAFHMSGVQAYLEYYQIQ